jgi:hypothetical protein
MPVPFGMNQLFCAKVPEGLMVAAEICEDLWAPKPPSVEHALAGANVIVNLSASQHVCCAAIFMPAPVMENLRRILYLAVTTCLQRTAICWPSLNGFRPVPFMQSLISAVCALNAAA